MAEVGTIGLDTAKRVFQVHGVDTAGAIVFRRQLRRAEMVRSSPSCRPVSPQTLHRARFV
jgi:transposase